MGLPNIRNLKSQVAIFLFAILCISILAQLTTMTFASIEDENESAATDVEMYEADSPEELAFMENQPIPLTEEQTASAISIASKDLLLSQTAEKLPTVLMSQGFGGNVLKAPGKWYPVLHYNVGNKSQISVAVDLEEGKIVGSETGPLDQFGTERSYALAYYDHGSHPERIDNIFGLYMHPTAPQYTSIAGNQFVAFLLNAKMKNSNNAYLCNHVSAGSTTYWSQTGFDFAPTHGAILSWTDTKLDCLGQDVPSFIVPYAAGSNYRFRIYTDSPNSRWIIFMQKIGTGETYTIARTGMSLYKLRTTDFNTSVWLENSNTNTIWDNQFSTDMVTRAYYRQTEGSSTWWGWDRSIQVDRRPCSPVQRDDLVITGNLAQAQSTTWSWQKMADWTAC